MKIKALIAAFLVLLISGCGQPKTIMDRPAEDGKYHYSNESLKFSVVLPAEFIYYQTQRKDMGSYVDIEFFVPTNDYDAFSEIDSYAKPLVVRVFNQDYDRQDYEDYIYVGENDGKFYSMLFWTLIPGDWTDRWTADMKDEIMSSFSLE